MQARTYMSPLVVLSFENCEHVATFLYDLSEYFIVINPFSQNDLLQRFRIHRAREVLFDATDDPSPLDEKK
jgi:hypothetical protein